MCQPDKSMQRTDEFGKYASALVLISGPREKRGDKP